MAGQASRRGEEFFFRSTNATNESTHTACCFGRGAWAPGLWLPSCLALLSLSRPAFQLPGRRVKTELVGDPADRTDGSALLLQLQLRERERQETERDLIRRRAPHPSLTVPLSRPLIRLLCFHLLPSALLLRLPVVVQAASSPSPSSSRSRLASYLNSFPQRAQPHRSPCPRLRLLRAGSSGSIGRREVAAPPPGPAVLSCARLRREALACAGGKEQAKLARAVIFTIISWSRIITLLELACWVCR